MKKSLALMLAVLLLLVLAACGGGAQPSSVPNASTPASASSAAESEPQPEELPYAEITEFIIEDGATITADLLFYQEIEKNINVKIEPTVIPKTEAKEKLNLLLASKTLPDLLNLAVALDGREYCNTYGPEGAFIPLDEQMDKLQNLKHYMDEYADTAYTYELATAPDGHIYGAPLFLFHNNGGNHLVARMDVLKEHDLKIPETFDDFYDLLSTLKQLYPDSYPLTSPDGARIVYDMDALFGAYDGFDYETGTFREDKRLTQNFLDMLNFLKKTYKDKLLDPDFPSMTRDTFTSNMITGKSLVYAGYASWGDNINLEAQVTDPDFNLKAFLHPTVNGVRYSVILSDIVNAGRWAVSSLSPADKQDAALRVIDYLYSEEGIENVIYGVEGMTYEKVDGKYQFLPEILTNRNPEGTINIGDTYAFRRHGFYGVYPFVEDFVGPGVADIGKEVQEKGLVVPMSPPVILTEEDSKTVADIKTQVDTLFNEEMLKYIMTDMTEAEWLNVVETARGMNIDTIREINQRLYEEQYP